MAPEKRRQPQSCVSEGLRCLWLTAVHQPRSPEAWPGQVGQLGRWGGGERRGSLPRRSGGFGAGTGRG